MMWQKNIAYLCAKQHRNPLELGDDPTVSQLTEAATQLGVDLQDLMFYNLQPADLPWETIRFIFLDVDGVLTEGGMHYTESGDEFKRFDTKDGMGIKLAMKGGYQFGIISSGVNRTIIEHRAQMFGIEHVYVGTEPKLGIATGWLENLGISWAECAYIGDDVNDLQMIERVGIAACPSDATKAVKDQVDLVLNSKGGHGCVRELVTYLPNAHARP